MNIKIRQESPTGFEAVFQRTAEAFSGEDESKLVETLRRSETLDQALKEVEKQVFPPINPSP